MRHRNDVDGLRAIAVLGVLVYHFNFGLFSGGFTGVDIFFVISGYVISSSIVSDIAAQKFSFSSFYFKRIRRIFPAYVALILFTTLISTIFLLPSDLLDYDKSVISTTLYYSNFFFWKDSGYFQAAAHTKPLLHTWSLAVEEQFYIFSPLLIWGIYRYCRQRWLTFLIPMMALSFAMGVAAIYVAPTAGFFLLPSRAWELMVGVLIALVDLRLPSNRVIREIGAATGALLIIFGMIQLAEDDPFPGWNALFPCIGAALIIVMGKDSTQQAEVPWVNRLLATRPLVFIGLISYSLYLVHWPIVCFARYLSLREPTPTEGCSMLIVSLALAWLSWWFVERPFRLVGLNHRRMVFAGAGIATLAILLIGEVGVIGNGFPARFPDFAMQHIQGNENWGGTACFNQNPAEPIPWNAEVCTRIHGTGGRILLWGDSFAAQYIPGILQNENRINADVLQYTFAGCPPIFSYFSFARVGCSISNERVKKIIADQNIDTVVISARWTDVPKHSLERLGETVKTLKQLGVRVYVLGQSPEFAADVQHIDYISGSRMAPGEPKWRVFFDPSFNDRLKTFATPEAIFIDPLKFLCDGVDCIYRHDTEFYYADYGHYSGEGSLRAVRAFFPIGRSPQSR